MFNPKRTDSETVKITCTIIQELKPTDPGTVEPSHARTRNKSLMTIVSSVYYLECHATPAVLESSAHPRKAAVRKHASQEKENLKDPSPSDRGSSGK